MKNYGFKQDAIEPENYFLGASPIPEEVLQADRDWTPHLPAVEIQNENGVETYNCTSFGTLNCIETLMRRKFGGHYDYSDRYLGTMAGTGNGGNSPHVVAETIRNASGLIPDDKLSFTLEILSIDQYYSPKPMEAHLIRLGKQWLEQYEFKHEWVFKPSDTLDEKQKKLMTALTFSPIGVSVHAWRRNGELFTKPNGVGDNHWVMLYGAVDGQYWLVFDHYDQEVKKLEWNYDFGCAKRYWVNKLEPTRIVIKKPSFLASLWAWLVGKRKMVV